jgi:hypothetical protein
MQYILKDTAKNSESILVQTVNDSKLRYHSLFETFQNEILLLDADTGVVPDVNNSFGLLTFSKLNEIPVEDLAIPPAVQQMVSEDILFLFNFNTNLTEKPEEINLPGIGQLPTITNDQVQGILNRENTTNPIHTQAELNVQDLNSYLQKRGKSYGYSVECQS